ncbi:hypothetical protein AMTR_s00075p00191460 [Amborella trichopoda]|uniref:Uncharacterized protein n=1 Tax=Amborella trichopoda TaxID=13333 RepID=W1PAJ5_AMBTC|nr:hypothetical protein AMTR_s00075p00191460 [Amborella trichopoda]
MCCQQLQPWWASLDGVRDVQEQRWILPIARQVIVVFPRQASGGERTRRVGGDETRPSIGKEHLIIAKLGLFSLLKETFTANVLDEFFDNPFDDDAHFKVPLILRPLLSPKTHSVMDKKTTKPFHPKKLKQ